MPSHRIGAGLGYLAVGLAFGAAWTFWVLKGRRVADDMAADLVARAASARRGFRWTYGIWGAKRMRDPDQVSRAGFWMWLPFVLFLPIIAIVLLVSSIVEFAR